jgi:hypothetical protein
MSRIYFHSQSDTAELRGSERVYAGGVVNDIFEIPLGLSGLWMSAEDIEGWRSILPSGCYLRRGEAKDFADRLRTWLRVEDAKLTIDGTPRELFSLKLNTAMRWGNDAVRLLARLHGQCEIHAYVEGEHRAWLADIIGRGRSMNVLRPDEGWENVVAMLRRRNDEPVVTSYSVCEGFPSPYLLGIREDDDAERWWKQPADVRWEQSMRELREHGPLMDPQAWDGYNFRHGLDASDILKALRAHRVSMASREEGGVTNA